MSDLAKDLLIRNELLGLQEQIQQLQAKNERPKDELQKYIYAATMADCFVDLKPTHPFYESIRQDLKASIMALKGGDE